jgi:eukaryotic-like serine/threonine-protein kinase
MTCPDEAAVDRFVAGQLDEPSRRRVMAHLASCDPCCHLVGALVMSTSGDSPSPATRVPLPEGGARLSRYRIAEPLGVGGMGIVYSAYDPELDRRVALKVLWSSSPRPHEAARLHREARAMAKLAHPNVVRVLDVGVDDGRVFLTMELVEGGTMRDWLKRGPHPWREVVERFRQAGAGLAAAHRAGLVHRDFKPENLLLRHDGVVLVTDFGLAHEVPFGEAASTLTSAERATTGTSAAGTPAYMAPEQLRGETLDARADVFAFSVALWEALYGAHPFAAGAPETLLERIGAGPPTPASPPSGDGAPERLRLALERGMSFRRRDRPSSMDALLAECVVEPRLEGSWRAWRRRALLPAAALLALATGVALGRRSAPAPPEWSEAQLASAPVSTTVVAPAQDAPPAPASAPSSVEVATATSDTVAQRASSAPPSARPPRTARAKKGALRGMDFTPYGMSGAEASAVATTHASDFDACWAEGCVDITCRFEVGADGQVSRATCSTWEGRPACPRTEACVAARIRALRFPPPPGAGECALYFAGR